MADSKIIKINPVTRIEGHAKISLFLDDQGGVSDAQFHVDEFRGFEKFCEGRLYTEMPVITPRICGICPVSHSLASAKACDSIQRVAIPETAVKLRRLIQLGQQLSSHALSFFYLSAPDFLLGWDSDPALRNVVGLAARFPDVARKGIRLRKFGQEISQHLTGKKIHTDGVIAGGMTNPMRPESRETLLKWIPEALETSQIGLKLLKDYMAAHKEEVETFAPSGTLHMGLVQADGTHELYDGKLRWVDASGKIVKDQVNPADYLNYIAEMPVDFSYLKYPYYKPLGYPEGIYRVGPLSRLNVASKMKTPKAQAEFEAFKALGHGRAVNGTFFYHYARLIETIACVEEIEMLLSDKEILSTDVHVVASRNALEGVGCCEAPRGTLFHHYKVDTHGQLLKVNLLIATGQNNPSMNKSVLEVARQYVKGADVKEGALNRVEAAIRCYDPCLSCSTHALGSMPMVLKIHDHQGNLIRSVERN
jgi:NAD-reducing hydrogenase large subunit